jgi:hypothetical protein
VSQHFAINLAHRCVYFVLYFGCDMITLFAALVDDCTCRASLENLVAMATDAIHDVLRHLRNIKRRLTLFEEQKTSTQQHTLSYLLDRNVRSLFRVLPL